MKRGQRLIKEKYVGQRPSILPQECQQFAIGHTSKRDGQRNRGKSVDEEDREIEELDETSSMRFKLISARCTAPRRAGEKNSLLRKTFEAWKANNSWL